MDLVELARRLLSPRQTGPAPHRSGRRVPTGPGGTERLDELGHERIPSSAPGSTGSRSASRQSSRPRRDGRQGKRRLPKKAHWVTVNAEAQGTTSEVSIPATRDECAGTEGPPSPLGDACVLIGGRGRSLTDPHRPAVPCVA